MRTVDGGADTGRGVGHRRVCLPDRLSVAFLRQRPDSGPEGFEFLADLASGSL